MNCPYCQSPMEQGYIQSRDGIVWTKKEHFVMALAPYAADAVKVATRRDHKSAEAYLCRSCKKVVIDYHEIEECYD